jgi:hypothetical protein
LLLQLEELIWPRDNSEKLIWHQLKRPAAAAAAAAAKTSLMNKERNGSPQTLWTTTIITTTTAAAYGRNPTHNHLLKSWIPLCDQ